MLDWSCAIHAVGEKRDRRGLFDQKSLIMGWKVRIDRVKVVLIVDLKRGKDADFNTRPGRQCVKIRISYSLSASIQGSKR